MTNKITIASMNCRSLNDKLKRRDVIHKLREKGFKIYCLQDTRFNKRIEQFVRNEWGYKCLFASYKSNARGVAILFNNNFDYKIHDVKEDKKGNYIIVSLTINQEKIVLVNVYGPNSDSPNFYKELTQKLQEYENPNIVCCADWNLVLDPTVDYSNYKHVNNPEAADSVKVMMETLALTDIWRENNRHKQTFTFRKDNPRQQARLDFFLMSDFLYWAFENAKILPGYRTDHSLITLTLQFGEKITRNTFWKFNTQNLKDEKYVNEINEEILEVINEYSSETLDMNDLKNKSMFDVDLTIPDKVFLDFLLMKIRSKSIAYSAMKKKQLNEKERNINDKIETLEKKENKNEQDFKKKRLKTLK